MSANDDVASQLFMDLSFECLPRGFSVFDFPTGQLPHPRQRHGLSPLCCEEEAVADDRSTNNVDLRHCFPSGFGTSGEPWQQTPRPIRLRLTTVRFPQPIPQWVKHLPYQGRCLPRHTSPRGTPWTTMLVRR